MRSWRGWELRIAGVLVRVSSWFVFAAVYAGGRSTRNLWETSVVPAPPMPAATDPVAFADWLERYGVPQVVMSRASLGQAVATGVAVTLVFALSVLVHELGHLLAAQAVGVRVSALDFNLFGGFAELDDDDRLTAGRLALIVAGGPAATLGVIVATILAGHALGSSSDAYIAADLAIDRVIAWALGFNVFALAINLLPLRPLDGGQLLGAVRHGLARSGRAGARRPG